MKKVNQVITAISVIVGLILAGFFVYDRWIKPERIELEVNCIDATQLTKLPVIEGFKANFQFKDSVVTNLWRVKYIITNIGTKTIIGEGAQRNIIENKLKLYFKDSVSLLDIQIIHTNFPIKLLKDKLSFKQWRPKEFIEVIAFVEPKTIINPTLQIDERDLIDGKVINSIYMTNEKKKENKLIDYLPAWLSSGLKWIITIIVFISIIAIAIGVNKKQKEDAVSISIGVKILTYVMIIIVGALFATPLLWIF